jgi:hypothetical protein
MYIRQRFHLRNTLTNKIMKNSPKKEEEKESYIKRFSDLYKLEYCHLIPFLQCSEDGCI